VTKYLKITAKELQALIDTADTCWALADEFAEEGIAAVKAYKSVLKRNGLELTERKEADIKIPNCD
jgi:hypothetical protein